MTEISKSELIKLTNELENDPRNLDLLNSLAISYFENYDLKTDKEDFDYFEKAYNLEKTVKSTHNFAWFLYFEWSEIEWRWNLDNAIERALNIQKECIALAPKTYYPYYQYGYMLLDQKKFKEAIPYLERAYEIEKRRDILHNIGYCYFQLDNFTKSREYFAESVVLDKENKSLYNLALTEFKLNNIERVKEIADILFSFEFDSLDVITAYEVGLLYFLIGNFQNVTNCLIKQGVSSIDLCEWEYLSFSLYKTNNELWHQQINESITRRIKICSEIESNHPNWVNYTSEFKNERLHELKFEIEARQNLLKNEMLMPIEDVYKHILIETCGCLLFDCKRHKNMSND